MAVEPLSRISLQATSVADDLGFVALADLARVLGSSGEVPHRVIGGQMVMVLAARWSLGRDLYRVTLDADLGAPPMAIRDLALVERLEELGYGKVGGNRFAKPIPDVPAGDEIERVAVIDILLPAYTSRPSQRKKVGDIIAIEALGLATALQRPPVVTNLELHRISGEVLNVVLSFPDEASALALKVFVAHVRSKPTDRTDVWRCLEIAHAAGVTPSAFAGNDEMKKAADLVRKLFSDRHGPGMSALIQDQGLSDGAADRRYTRILALIGEILGS